MNLLAHLYFEGGMAYMGYNRFSPNGLDRVVVENPYGIAGMGLNWQSKKFSVDFGVRHLSSTATGHDHGDNMTHFTVRYMPWKGE